MDNIYPQENLNKLMTNLRQLTLTLCAASSPMRLRLLGRWRILWSCTSCAVTVCWRASESAERASQQDPVWRFQAEVLMNTKHLGHTWIKKYCHFQIFNIQWFLVSFLIYLLYLYLFLNLFIYKYATTDIVSWTLLPSQMVSSLTAGKELKSYWDLWILTITSTSLDILRYLCLVVIAF